MSDNDYEGFWKETLNRLRTDLGEEEFGGWFSDLVLVRSGENRIVLGVPSVFHHDTVKKRYQNVIKKTLKELSGREINLEFEVNGAYKAEKAATPEIAAHENEKTDQNPASGEPDGAVSIEKQKKKQHPQMRDNYTFETYIIGENNKYAANAAIAISRNPGDSYNPFLIYGGVGLGKTHLMQAVGNYIHENSDNKVICITSEDFLNEYMEGIKANKMNAFKNKFRYTDVLLIDDIQFLSDKPGCQDELFFTFEALLTAKKQLIFTCDRPPSELKKFNDRLISRFTQGIRVDLQPPRYEVRCAILQSTAENRGALISGDIIDLIAKNISSNIRDLISALNTIISYTELVGPITLEIAQQRLRDMLVGTKQTNLSIENIQRVVADYFSLTPNDLKGKKKSQNIVFPRQLAMYIAREMTDYSTTEMGQSFGGRDHTTVMYSIDKIKAQLLTDPTLDSKIESLKRSIKEFSVKS